MRKARRIFIIILIMVLLGLGLFLMGQVRNFTDYDVESTVAHSESSTTEYIAFGDYLVKYSSDGVTCIDENNVKIWNQSYEMENPIIAVESDSLALGEKGGRQIFVFSKTGYEGKIDTIYSIREIDVANGGIVAAVLEKDGLYYLALYDKTGTELAKGTIHLENSGYPASIALSEDGEKLAVAFINIAGGEASTEINFYNFSSVGQNEIDNIVGSYSYEGTVIPEIGFLDNDTCVAFGDDRIILFKGSQKPEPVKEIELSTEINSVFYGEEVFGTVEKNDIAAIMASGDSDEAYTYEIRLYSKSGREIFSKGFDLAYKSIYVLSNGEICVQGEEAVEIITHYGLEKFKYSFDEKIKLIRYKGLIEGYEFVFTDRCDSVKLS